MNTDIQTDDTNMHNQTEPSAPAFDLPSEVPNPIEIQGIDHTLSFPEIQNDSDFSDATALYTTMPDMPEKETIGGAIADFQTQRVLRDYVDPARNADEKQRMEKIDRLDALSRDWAKFPAAREKVVAVYGEEFAKEWENASADHKAFVGGQKVLDELYSRDGDGEFGSYDRYMDSTGTSNLAGNGGVWRHFTGQLKPRQQEEEKQNALLESYSRKCAPVLRSLMEGKMLSEALSSADLTPEEATFAMMECGYGSKWYQSMERAKSWTEKNGLATKSFSRHEIQEKADQMKSAYSDSLGWTEYQGPTADEWRVKAREELESSNPKMTDARILDFSKNLLQLKKEDPDAYGQIIGLYRMEIDQARNDGTAFFSPMSHMIGSMVEKGGVFLNRMMIGDLESGDTVVLRQGAPNSFPIPHTYDKDGKYVVRPPKQEVSQQLSEINAMLAEIAESPDGASWFRRQIDGLGSMAGQTAVYLGTYGIGTFASTAGDRFNELHGSGESLGSSLLRATAAGGTEVLTERLGGEFFGRNMKWLAKKVPGARKVTGYFGGASDMLKRGMYKQAGLRYGAASVGAGFSEWAEEIIQPTLQAPLDAGLAWAFGSDNGMTVEDWKKQVTEACSADLAFQMFVFGAACGVVQAPGMAREAQIARMGKGQIQTLTRCTDERAAEIADLWDPVEKRQAIMEACLENTLTRDMQEDNMRAGISNMQEDFSSLKAMEAYQAEVELGNMPRYEENEDGSWTAYDKTADKDGKTVEAERVLPAEIAQAEINTKLEEGMMTRVMLIQNNLVARAAVDTMQTDGKFIFEKMKDTETIATLEKLAVAAGLRMENGASADSVDPSLSRYVKLGEFEPMVQAARKREEIARTQGQESPFASNAYRKSLSRSHHLIRFVEGKITINDLIEESVESSVMDYLRESGLGLDWAAGNLRETQRLLKESGALKDSIITEEGKVEIQDVVEAMGYLARGDVFRRIDSLNIPEFLKDFLKWVRMLFNQSHRLAEVGRAFYELDQAGRIDGGFAQAIYDAAGIVEDVWKGAAMDSTHAELARIASMAVSGKVNEEDIAQGIYQVWKEAAGNADGDTASGQDDGKNDVVNVLRELDATEDEIRGATGTHEPTVEEQPEPTKEGRFAEAMKQKLTERIGRLKSGGGGTSLKAVADLEMQRAAWNDMEGYPELLRQAKTWDGESSLDDIEPAVADVGIDMSASISYSNELDSENPDITFSVSESWKKNLRDYLNGSDSNKRRDIQICPTPAVLRALGAKAYDLVITPSVIDKVMNGKHAVEVAEMEKLADALREPLAVFSSATQAESLVVLTEMTEGESNVVVAVHLEAPSMTNQYSVKVNRVASLYGKENARALWYTPLRYLDIKKARPWMRYNRLQLPEKSPRTGSTTKILTPADIVKWKNGNQDDDFRDTASFSVVGPTAKNWDSIKESAFHGRDDGKQRVEIDASQATIHPGLVRRIERRLSGDRGEKKVLFRLRDVLDFPELYAAYPKLASMAVHLADLGSRGTRAWYNPQANNIKINTLNFQSSTYDLSALRSTLLHEIQHAIQRIEGYARGSGGADYERYLRAGGEIEARNVQKRMDMTPAERAANPFNETLEYPGEAWVSVSPDPIEVPFNLVTGESSRDWGAMRRSGNKAHMEFVKLIVDALNKDAERMLRYNDLSEDERGDMAITLMRATNLAKTAAMYLPKGYRIGLKPYLDWMEVFSEVAHRGSMQWSSTAPAPYWASLMRGHLAKIEGLYSISTNDEAQALELLKDYGNTRLYMLVNKLIKRVSSNLEEYGKCKLRDRIDALLESCAPKEKDSHQYKTGAVSFDSYRELARLNGMMLMDEKAFEEKLMELEGRLAHLRQQGEESDGSGEQEQLEQLENEKLELEVYGCMGRMSLDELDRLHVSLTRFVRGEKAAWQQALEERKERRRLIGEAIVAGVAERKGEESMESTSIARARNDQTAKGKNKGWLRRTFIGLQTIESLPQLLSVMERFPDTALMAHHVRLRMGRASAYLDIADKRVNRLFRKWAMESFGAKNDFALDKKLTEFKRKSDTGIHLNIYERKNVRLPLDIARLMVQRDESGNLTERAQKELDRMKEEDADWKTRHEEQLMEELRTKTGSLDTDDAVRRAKIRTEAHDAALDADAVAALKEWIADYDSNYAAQVAEAKAGQGRMPKEKEYADVTYNRLVKTEKSTLELARDSALYLVLLSEQEQYAQLMELQGFDAGVIEQMKTFVGAEGMELGRKMRGHLQKQGGRIGRVFQAVTGVPFPQIRNYFPARFKIDNRLVDFDMAQMLAGYQGQYGSSATAMLHNRTKHNSDLDLNMCATSVFRDAVAMSEHWMQTQDIVADMRGILGTKKVLDALTVQFGRNPVALLKQWVRGLENCGRMDGNAKSQLDVTTGELYNAGAVSVLSYKMESIIRQLSGVANMWAGDNTLSAKDWARGMALTTSGNGAVGVADMLKNDYIKARILTTKDIAGSRIARMSPGQRFGKFDRLAHLGMVPLGALDAMSNALPATVLFNAHFAKAKAEANPDGSKRTDAECRRIAWDYTYAAFAKGAQPTRAWDKSHFGNMLSSLPMGRAFAFMMSENFNKLGLVASLMRQGKWGKAAGVWVTYGILNAAIGMLLDWMRDDPDKWEERDMMGYLWAVAFGNLSGIPLVSEGLEWMIGKMGGKVYLGSAGKGVLDGGAFLGASGRLWKMSTDEKEYSFNDWMKSTSGLMRTFGAVGGAASAAGSKLGSMVLYFSALGNPVKSAAGLKDSAMLNDPE